MGELMTMIANAGVTNKLKYPSFVSVVYGDCNNLEFRGFEMGSSPVCSGTRTMFNPDNAPILRGKTYTKSKSDVINQIIPDNVIDQIAALMKTVPPGQANFELKGYTIGPGPAGSTPNPMQTISSNYIPFPSRQNSLYVLQYAVPGGANSNNYYPGSFTYNFLSSLEKLLAPYVNGYKIQNFMDLDQTDYGNKYYGAENFKRLIQIKNIYDPTNFFNNDQSIPLLHPSNSTVKPTTKPTIKTTIKPTTKPTIKPTTKPTIKPTTKPTIKTTIKPTIKPTTKPTIKPTTKPSKKPSIRPTTAK
jgi:hypothetical protein